MARVGTAAPFGLPKGRDGIRGFAALTDDHKQRIFGNDRVAVAELGRYFHLGGNAGYLLKDVSRDMSGVERRAAAADDDSPDAFCHVGGNGHNILP